MQMHTTPKTDKREIAKISKGFFGVFFFAVVFFA
jgi:hypothetical protein